jgi:hypothetical protein
MFSGGLGSWATAKRVAEAHGTDDLWLIFADVGGDNPSPHAGEDEDTYRFVIEGAANIYGIDYDPTLPEGSTFRTEGRHTRIPGLVWLTEGRDIWQVFHDNRFLGNSRLANCSKFLKQQPCRAWLDRNCDPETTTVYVGIDWTESNRLPAIVNAYLPFKAQAPMTEPPFLDFQAECVAAGIEIPRLYRAAFPHNNCGGGCVRAGQAQFELLLREYPARYAYWEAQEEDLRQYLHADVAILRDRSTPKTTAAVDTSVPLTLRRFRERIEAQPTMFDALDFGGCGCFVAEEVPS